MCCVGSLFHEPVMFCQSLIREGSSFFSRWVQLARRCAGSCIARQNAEGDLVARFWGQFSLHFCLATPLDRWICFRLPLFHGC